MGSNMLEIVGAIYNMAAEYNVCKKMKGSLIKW